MTTAPRTPLQGALDWSSRGFNVFPCAEWRNHGPKKSPGKYPLVLDWENAATTDHKKISAWAVQFPNCNWGCALGRSGHVVFDLDRKKGNDGVAELDRLSKEHGFAIPPTLIVATPSGGFHLYFTGTAPLSAGTIAPGLDVRSVGGYVVIPGSVIDGKPYAVEHNVEEWDVIPDAPPQLLALTEKRKTAPKSAPADVKLDQPQNIARAIHYLKEDARPAVEGQGGDDRTYKTAAAVRDLGISEGLCLELMAKYYNPRCKPAWSQDELATKVANAYRYADNEAGCDAVAPVTERIPSDTLDKYIAESAASPLAAIERARARFSPIPACQFNSLPLPSYVVDQIIPNKGIVVIYGESGAFKSFLKQNLLASTAAGILAFDRYTTVQGDVVMSAGEAPFGMARKRVPAWALAHGVDLNTLPLNIVPAVPLVSDGSEIKEFVGALKAASLRPKIVSFDTVARMAGGLDENEARTAGLIIAAAEYVIAELDCSVLLIHHSGKEENKGPRGSSALFAGVDAVWKVTRAKDTLAVTLTCEKMKDADPPADIHLQGQPVAGSLVFSAISADEHAALSRTNPPLSQADIQKALRAAGATGGVEVSTRQLAVTMLAGSGGDPKAIQAMERRLRRGAAGALAAYVTLGSGNSVALKWTFPTVENEGSDHA